MASHRTPRKQTTFRHNICVGKGVVCRRASCANEFWHTPCLCSTSLNCICLSSATSEPWNATHSHALRRKYNTVRPHSSLGYQPPAPEAIQPCSLASATPQRANKAGLLAIPTLT